MHLEEVGRLAAVTVFDHIFVSSFIARELRKYGVDISQFQSRKRLSIQRVLRREAEAACSKINGALGQCLARTKAAPLAHRHLCVMASGSLETAAVQQQTTIDHLRRSLSRQEVPTHSPPLDPFLAAA